MVELWQAILLLGAGAVVTLGSGYVQRLWAKSDTREADKRASARRLEGEQREAKRKADEEERQARRQYRRERAKPILDFLEMAKRYNAAEIIKRAIEVAWEQLDVGGIKDKLSLERFRKALDESAKSGGPDFYELGRAMAVAVATAPTPEITRQVGEVWLGVGSGETDEDKQKRLAAIASLAQLIEDYVTKV